MSFSDELLSLIDDSHRLISLLKEKSHLVISDSTYYHIVNHFLNKPISIESLAIQRNLYGRPRSSSLNQCEINLLILNIKECLHSTSKELTKTFLQYLHNINRLLPNNFHDLAYLCALIRLQQTDKNVITCILCAYLEMNNSNSLRYDLIINGLYENEDEEDNPWIDQLTKLLIENDRIWLRKYYLEKMYSSELLAAFDTHNDENIVKIDKITCEQSQEETISTNIEQLDLSQVLTIDDLHSTLSSYVNKSIPIYVISDMALFHLFSSSNSYPDDLYLLFACSLLSIINPTNYSIISLRLFRRLILLMNNYYINQHDLLDDNRYRLTIVFLVSKLLCEVHRRRSNSEHQWYQLYMEIPKEHPLPTFDLFADLLCLLATLCYNNINCQNKVRQTSGTIESILSMTQIDLNQPKAQACVTWLIKCLTEHNEHNRNYIKQIK